MRGAVTGAWAWLWAHWRDLFVGPPGVLETDDREQETGTADDGARQAAPRDA
jgi:hypothetical protein